jgi:ketosteroid isomerase-like protein
MVSRAEVLIDAGEVALVHNAYTGTGESTFGEFEIAMDLAFVLRDGRIGRIEIFDDEIAAWRRTAELLGGGRGGALALLARYLDAYQRRDWDSMAGLLREDGVVVDRRPVSLGRLDGAAAIVDMLRGMVELVPDAGVAFRVLDVADRVVLYRHIGAGHDRRGGEVEAELLVAAVIEDGRLSYIEAFPPDAEAEARTRFAELTAQPTPAEGYGNTTGTDEDGAST